MSRGGLTFILVDSLLRWLHIIIKQRAFCRKIYVLILQPQKVLFSHVDEFITFRILTWKGSNTYLRNWNIGSVLCQMWNPYPPRLYRIRNVRASTGNRNCKPNDHTLICLKYFLWTISFIFRPYIVPFNS